MNLRKYFPQSILLFFALNFNFVMAQVNITASGSKIGSSKKQIYPDNSFQFFSNEPQDFGVTIGNQTTATVIGRSIWYFNVPNSIPYGSQVYKV